MNLMQRGTLILSIITVASLIGNIVLYLGRTSNTPVISATQLASSSGDKAAAITSASTLEAKTKDLEAQLKQAKEVIKRISAEKAQTTPPAAVVTSIEPSNTITATKGKDLKNMLGVMMNDPALKDFAIQQQIAQLENKYAGLIDHLQLTSEEKTHFKKLLSERISKETVAGVQLMQPNLSEEQQRKIAQDISSTRKSYEQAISQFLNDANDFDTFKSWEDSIPEREMLQAGKVNFEAAGAALTAEQEDQLIRLMTKARNNRYEDLPDVYNTEAMVGVHVDDQFIAQLVNKNQKDQQFILQNAPQFLSQQQIPALQKFLQDQAKIYEATLKMSKQLIR
jgi:hypothetical protein